VYAARFLVYLRQIGLHTWISSFEEDVPRCKVKDRPPQLEAAALAMTRKDYRAAVEILRPLAKDNWVTAQHELRNVYFRVYMAATLVQGFCQTAIEILRPEAESGDSYARHMLGRVYKEVLGDNQEAYFWLRLSHDHGTGYAHLWKEMTKDQLAAVEKRISEWEKARPFDIEGWKRTDEEEKQRWLEAEKLLMADPTARVLCPKCQDGKIFIDRGYFSCSKCYFSHFINHPLLFFPEPTADLQKLDDRTVRAALNKNDPSDPVILEINRLANTYLAQLREYGKIKGIDMGSEPWRPHTKIATAIGRAALHLVLTTTRHVARE
jgi:TPR repeat protein